jgi:hypothetical protein
MNRRDFMKGSAMGLIGAGVAGSGPAAEEGRSSLLLQPQIDDGVPRATSSRRFPPTT